MQKKVRCAVIGTGWWGTMAHVPALLHHPQAELVVVHHRNQEIAEKIARDFGIAQGVSSVEDVLAVFRLREHRRICSLRHRNDDRPRGRRGQ